MKKRNKSRVKKRVVEPRVGKKYTPRETTLPIIFRHNAESEMILQLVPHQELDQLRQGKGEARNWHTITCRLNVGLTLAYNIFTDCKKELDDALECMRQIHARHQRIGKWILTGDELRIVGEGLNLTDEMQKNCTRRELAVALDVVLKQAAIYR